MHKLFTILGILLCTATNALGQDWSLNIYNDDASENFKPVKYEHVLRDSLGVLREIHVYILKLHELSFLEAAMDSVVYKNKQVEAFVHVGSKHNWSILHSGNVPDEYLYKSGYKQKFYSKTRFSYKELASLENRIIKYSENSGFPFARIELDSIQLTESYFSATLDYQSGPLIRFDTVALVGSARVKRKYIESYLGITPGALYNQQKAQNLERQLKQLQYLKVVKAPEIFFSAGKAQPVLFVNVRKCNQLDGYIGFQPNSSSSKKMLLTGEFNMNLKNLLQSGKELSVQWKRFDVQSQLLKTSYLHPRLFHSNIDIKLNFNLLKQDTSFLTLDRNAAIYMGLNATSKIKFFAGLKSNTALGSTQTNSNEGNNYDFKFFNYGVGYTLMTLDDIFYPMKGWNVTIDVSTGNKKILNYESLSTDIAIPTSAMQWTGETSVQAFIRVGKKATLLNQFQGGTVQSQNLVLSDLYRVGGLKTLRGFNENNYYVSDYAIYTLEYRYFTDESSYVMLFANQAYVHNKLNGDYTDWPIGFGTGISFSTKAGIFQFIYALGYAKDQPLSLNLSKIHFGLVSRF
ncbi:POTRA domain-containing protein [Cytophaga aurantiaca]|uniref:POTRA domain-containing protein n=1 Tax=Cytophaga aurantiaca TaxID=29530 RepID=UPI0006866AEB|nr:POTRA domain-containing protein [Cytophaga aurantiaca]